MIFHHAADHVFHKLHVAAVSGTEGEIHAAQIFGRIVSDHRIGKPAVGNGDALAVGGENYRIDHGNFRHRAAFAGSVNKVADFEGLEEEDHQSAGKVAQRTLQGKTDGNAAGGYQGDECGHGHAQGGKGCDDDL